MPKQPVRAGGRYEKSGGNTFLVVSLVMLGIALLAAAGVFGYKTYLSSVKAAKATQVQEAQQDIDAETVESFIRLRNRFAMAETLLDSRVATSRFFDVLERLTLQSVRFDSLSYELVADGSAEIRMNGTARTFNALAAQSAEFASEKRIKRAIFSDIGVGEGAGAAVTFSLSADLDPRLLTLEAEAMPAPVEETMPAAPTATTTAP